ncbi:MAG: deaminase [Acidimicrobiia bacterium]
MTNGLSFTCALPDWISSVVDYDEVYESDEDKVGLANALAMGNVAHGTGGPFGAAVFDASTHRLVAPGVNLVVPALNPTAHAEIIAMAIAGAALGRYDLGDRRRQPMMLATSVEPCAMCLGAIPWSGISAVIIGARDEDARAAGFDEGDKPSDWIDRLHARDIAVTRDVLRNESVLVLTSYNRVGGENYSAATGSSS